MGFWHSVITKEGNNITDSQSVQVGYWFTSCCHRDLEEVTLDNIEHIRAELADEDVKVWVSYRDALFEIREYTFLPGDAEMKVEIDEMLARGTNND